MDPVTGQPGNGDAAAAGPGRSEPTVPVSLPARATPGAAAGDPVRAWRPLPWLTVGPRAWWWARRCVIAAAAGAALALAAGWQAGAAMAVLVVLADTLLRNRTTAVIPPAVRAGSARRRTRRRLRRLAPAGYLALQRRLIPGTDTVIGHLVIGPAGVFAVESQRWDRRLPVRMTHGELFHGPFSQAARLRQAVREAQRAGELISEAAGEPVTVRPAMAIYGPTVPWIVASIGGVDVFCGRRIRRYLRRPAGSGRGRRLAGDEVELILDAAARVLPPPGDLPDR